jgi:PAS domain S-box-containing protein
MINSSIPKNKEALFDAVFYDNPMPMWFYDNATLRFLEVNQIAIDRYGYSREEFLGMTIRDIRPVEEVPMLEYALSDTVPSFQRGTIFRHRLSNGAIRHVRIISYPSEFNGHQSRLVMVNDVTETVLLQQQREETEMMLHKIASASPTAIWMTNADGQLVYVNQTWLDWANVGEGGDLATQWAKSVHPDDLKRVVKAYREAHANQQAFQQDMRTFFADGSIRWLTSSANPRYDANQQYAGLVGSCTDITRIRHYEQQKDGFISTVSHELRTPIAAIKGYEQLLSRSKGNLDSQAQQFLERMRVQIGRIDSIVQDLLDISRIETGKLTFKESEFEVNSLMAELITDLQLVYRTHQLVLEENEQCKMFADRNRIIQLVTNLVDNAVKYSPGANKVVIRLWCDEENLTVSVRDSGKGVSKDQAAFIFERFYQVNDVYKAPGLGIGLYICKEIVNRLNGKIWFDSIPGHGTTFFFKLPRQL